MGCDFTGGRNKAQEELPFRRMPTFYSCLCPGPRRTQMAGPCFMPSEPVSPPPVYPMHRSQYQIAICQYGNPQINVPPVRASQKRRLAKSLSTNREKECCGVTCRPKMIFSFSHFFGPRATQPIKSCRTRQFPVSENWQLSLTWSTPSRASSSDPTLCADPDLVPGLRPMW